MNNRLLSVTEENNSLSSILTVSSFRSFLLLLVHFKYLTARQYPRPLTLRLHFCPQSTFSYCFLPSITSYTTIHHAYHSSSITQPSRSLPSRSHKMARRRRPPRPGAMTEFPPLKILTQILILQAIWYFVATVLILFTALVAGRHFTFDMVLSWRSLRGDTTVGWMLGLVWLLNSFIGYAALSASLHFVFWAPSLNCGPD